MVADNGNELEDTHTIAVDGLKNSRLLRSSAIYGPNASGKSNLLKAFRAMRRVVLNSASSKNSLTSKKWLEEEIVPHKFDHATVDAPTELEVIFIADGIRYQYGFMADKVRVYQEWLFAFPKGRSRRMMMREYNPDKPGDVKYDISFGTGIKGAKSDWKRSLREDALLLSIIKLYNAPDFNPVYDWFDSVVVLGVGTDYSTYTMQECVNEDFKKRVVRALASSDIKIHDITIRNEKIVLPEFLSDDLKKKMDYEIPRTLASHPVVGGGYTTLYMEEESEGTQKLFSLIGLWIDILEKGAVVLVDELSDRLHPLLLRFLVQKFNNPEVNKSNAQLVFTSHDTALMKPEYLRRDQIWFVDKNKENATVLYPLTDFHPRKEVENFERNYLSGQYGALPYLIEIADQMKVE